MYLWVFFLQQLFIIYLFLICEVSFPSISYFFNAIFLLILKLSFHFELNVCFFILYFRKIIFYCIIFLFLLCTTHSLTKCFDLVHSYWIWQCAGNLTEGKKEEITTHDTFFRFSFHLSFLFVHSICLFEVILMSSFRSLLILFVSDM